MKQLFFKKDRRAVSTVFELLIALGVALSIILIFLFAAENFYDVYEQEDIDLSAQAETLLSMLISTPGTSPRLLPDWTIDPTETLHIGLAQNTPIDYGIVYENGTAISIHGYDTSSYPLTTNNQSYFPQDSTTYVLYEPAGNNYLFMLNNREDILENTLDYTKIQALETLITAPNGYSTVKSLLHLDDNTNNYDFVLSISNSSTILLDEIGKPIPDPTIDVSSAQQQVLIYHPPRLTIGQTSPTESWVETGVITLTLYYGVQ